MSDFDQNAFDTTLARADALLAAQEGEVVPMTSARLAAGTYEVLGTSRNCMLVRRAKGWHLVIDGHAVATFATKRAALRHCQADSSL